MTRLDNELAEVGQKRIQALADLAAIDAKLAPLIRRAREANPTRYTISELMRLTGYRSVDAVRQIIDPDLRAAKNSARRKPKA